MVQGRSREGQVRYRLHRRLRHQIRCLLLTHRVNHLFRRPATHRTARHLKCLLSPFRHLQVLKKGTAGIHRRHLFPAVPVFPVKIVRKVNTIVAKNEAQMVKVT